MFKVYQSFGKYLRPLFSVPKENEEIFINEVKEKEWSYFKWPNGNYTISENQSYTLVNRKFQKMKRTLNTEIFLKQKKLF